MTAMVRERSNTRIARRRFANRLLEWVLIVVAALVIVGMASVILVLVVNGVIALVSTPSGVLALLESALWESARMVGLSVVVAVPIGVASGVFFAQASRSNRFVSLIRFISEAMIGLPSVVAGVVVVVALGHIAGGVAWMMGSCALALLMMPVVANTTYCALFDSASSLREAAFVLGSRPWRTMLRVGLRASASGIVLGGLVGVAETAVEIAPILIAHGSVGEQSNASLHVLAYETFHSDASLAWASTLVLTVCAVAIVWFSRYVESKVR